MWIDLRLEGRWRSMTTMVFMLAGASVLFGALTVEVRAQDRGVPAGEWWQWGGDPWSTRYSEVDQIGASNFENLEVAWTWRTDNFGPSVDYILRSTPIYANGRIFTVAGQRRTAVALDPGTGETLWTFREPHTHRYERSERYNYGRGMTYAEVDGRGVVYFVTPAYFLYALDAESGLPLPGFGGAGPLPGFPSTGVVDMLADLGYPYDAYAGIPAERGTVTNSHPPMVVNGVVIVPSAGPRGRHQTREENVPGDVLGYDARTGELLWKFHVIPRPGEQGHETWENDAWATAGNLNPWAGMSADPELGIVYFGPDTVTNDYYGGFHPGDNLFSSSIVALDIQTGERLWHFQMVRHDIWDFDVPVPPSLVDVTVNGQRVPAVVQTTKQGMVYAFNRKTGDPLWPIEDRPVPQSIVPGEQTAATQPFPSRPAPYEMQGLSEDDIIDFTPELRTMALEAIKEFSVVAGHPYNPAVHRDNPEGLRGTINCPGSLGGTNIPGGTVVDPESGIIYVASVKSCSTRVMVPAHEMDDPQSDYSFGSTITDWASGPGAGLVGPEGLPIFRPPYGRITAIDMNTGEHLWWIPNGDTPSRISEHPSLQGLDLPPTGIASHATALVTRTLLMYGEGVSGRPLFHAVDKATGEHIGTVALPAPTNTAPMTFMHEGQQYILLSVGSGAERVPGSLVALRLP